MTNSRHRLDLNHIRYVISSLAVFVALWSLLAMFITATWYIVPFSSQDIMHSLRWPVSLGILLTLLLTGNITINKK